MARPLGALLMIALLAGVASPARGDHLHPTTSGLFTADQQADYDQAIRQHLLSGYEPRAHRVQSAAVVALPSFSTEWAVLLTTVEASGEGLLELRTVDQQIWAWMEPRDGEQAPRLVVRQKRLSAEATRMVIAVWESFLSEARYPHHRSGVVDGTTYEFYLTLTSYPRHRYPMSASLWSPDRCSRTGKLVELLETLKTFASVTNADGPSEEEIRDRAHVLVDSDGLDASIDACRKTATESSADTPAP